MLLFLKQVLCAIYLTATEDHKSLEGLDDSEPQRLRSLYARGVVLVLCTLADLNRRGTRSFK